MGFGLFLLDSETVNINKLDQKKRLRLEKLDRVSYLSIYLSILSIYLFVCLSISIYLSILCLSMYPFIHLSMEVNKKTDSRGKKPSKIMRMRNQVVDDRATGNKLYHLITQPRNI